MPRRRGRETRSRTFGPVYDPFAGSADTAAVAEPHRSRPQPSPRHGPRLAPRRPLSRENEPRVLLLLGRAPYGRRAHEIETRSFPALNAVRPARQRSSTSPQVPTDSMTAKRAGCRFSKHLQPHVLETQIVPREGSRRKFREIARP